MGVKSRKRNGEHLSCCRFCLALVIRRGGDGKHEVHRECAELIQRLRPYEYNIVSPQVCPPEAVPSVTESFSEMDLKIQKSFEGDV